MGLVWLKFGVLVWGRMCDFARLWLEGGQKMFVLRTCLDGELEADIRRPVLIVSFNFC
jgi:hypothetical protein